MPYQVVAQGENAFTLAWAAGIEWKTVWEHANNADLRRARKDPNALLPGDVLFIPDKNPPSMSCATNQRHQFKIKGVPARLQLTVKRQGKPLAGKPFKLALDQGEPRSGTTSGAGVIDVTLPIEARSGTLTVGDGDDRVEYRLALNHLDPIESVSGAQGRLNNLGFHCGVPDGKLTPETRAALRAFQRHAGLPTTGELDDATRAKLDAAHEGG